MADLILSDEQAEQVRKAAAPMIAVNGEGEPVGIITPKEHVASLSGVELDEILQRMSGANTVWRTTDEVIERIKSRAAE